MARLAGIVFHVQDDAGAPVADALISAQSPNGAWSGLTNGCGDLFAMLSAGHYDATISATGYTTATRSWDLGEAGTVYIGLSTGGGGLPPIDRDTLLRGRLRFQGLNVTLPRFGTMPWWGGCWGWLTREERADAARQLLAQGEQIALMDWPSGKPLYDETGQFYSPDKFPALTLSASQMASLIDETLRCGFKGCWVVLDGDDAPNGGAQRAIQQVGDLGTACRMHSAPTTLCPYVVPIPGYDGVWHKPIPGQGTGYTPDQIHAFADAALMAGFTSVGIEQGTGYLLAGGGAADYQGSGPLAKYSLVLGEFDDGAFSTGDFWQVLGRDLAHYVQPPEQQMYIAKGPPPPSEPPNSLWRQAYDPHPPYVLAGWPGVFRVFEYGLYGFVRSTPPTTITAWRQHFLDAGAVESETC